MNYKLHTDEKGANKEPFLTSIKRIGPLLKGETKNLVITLFAVVVSSLSVLIAPVVIASTIDTYIKTKDYHGILINSAVLFGVYVIGSYASFIQTKTMGGVGRRVLFNLRNNIFTKLQELPVAFFNQNKAGDLISRINNDTDKLNQFISQALMQFFGNFFLIIGSGIFILVLNLELGFATLLPATGVLIVTQILSPWVKRKNLESLQSTGGMSSEIQESLNNFKVIVAFNRLDYFREKFEESNQKNYSASIQAGIASNILIPIYGLASNLAQLVALGYGIMLISTGNITLGLLIGFQFYVNNFYTPLRQLASTWASFQLALASLDRVSEVLALDSDMVVMKDEKEVINFDSENGRQFNDPAITAGQVPETSSGGQNTNDLKPVPTDHKKFPILEFQGVGFHYPDGSEILKSVSFKLEKGKTYALVGPTGGGKTTTASLMARLYDPTSGKVLLDKKDIRSYEPALRAKKIGFILQEPFLFTGTVRENILYGNDEFHAHSDAEVVELLEKMGLTNLLSKFENGLNTKVSTSGESISLGQKQLLAFMRAILRSPELLILDEATANIDTVTEQLLEEMLSKLPTYTTKVIIAHRLNTIKDADEIFFVNGGEVTNTGSMEHAIDMLLHGKRKS